MMHRSIIPIYIILLFSIALIFPGCAENNEETAIKEDLTDSLDPILEDYESPERKIGFINEDGEIVIEPKFDEASHFNNGLAAVNINGFWGYVGPYGEMEIPAVYLGTWTFYNDLGRVQSASNRLFGYINEEGDTVVPIQYSDARDFQGDLAAVKKDNYWGVIDRKGNEVISPQYDDVEVLSNDYISFKEKNNWGLYHLEEKMVIPPLYLRIFSLKGDVLRVQNSVGRFLFVDLDNRSIFNKHFFQADDPQNGYYSVCDSARHCYLLDKEGKQITEVYENIHPGNEGTFIAKKGGKWGVLDSEGKAVTPFTYDLIYNFEQGYAPYLKNSLWGYLSADGREMTSPQFGLAWPFQNGKARVLTREGTVVLNENFEVIISAEVGEIRDFNDGLAAFKAY